MANQNDWGDNRRPPDGDFAYDRSTSSRPGRSYRDEEFNRRPGADRPAGAYGRFQRDEERSYRSGLWGQGRDEGARDYQFADRGEQYGAGLAGNRSRADNRDFGYGGGRDDAYGYGEASARRSASRLGGGWSEDQGQTRAYGGQAATAYGSAGGAWGDSGPEDWRYGDDRGQNRDIGQHRGRGPKGYTRSDERIREDVNDRLTDHPQVDATGVAVTVKDGEVTLAGLVHGRREKRLAEDLAEQVSGVKHVQNNLRIHDSNYNAATATAGSTVNAAPAPGSASRSN
jgi:hypothetical protein